MSEQRLVRLRLTILVTLLSACTALAIVLLAGDHARWGSIFATFAVFFGIVALCVHMRWPDDAPRIDRP